MNGPELRDIHLPPEPGIWPLTPASWLVLVLALIALAVLLRWLLARLGRWRRRRAVIIELRKLQALCVGAPQAALVELALLLRRSALMIDPPLAALPAPALLAALDGRSKAPELAAHTVLVDGPWRRAAPDPDQVRDALAASVRWAQALQC